MEPVRVVVSHAGRAARGEVAPGESWAEAARRVCGGGLDPVAVDLSGPVKLFLADPPDRAGVRPMVRGDLRDLARWLGAPHVRRWWAAEGAATIEAVRERYLPRLEGGDPTRMWVFEVNGRSIGFAQDYRIADYPEYALLVPDPAATGIDYAIGDPGWLSRGWGVRLVWATVRAVLRTHPGTVSLFAAPDHRNAPSLRALDKCGFRQGTWFDEPQEDGSVATVVGCSLSVPEVLA